MLRRLTYRPGDPLYPRIGVAAWRSCVELLPSVHEFPRNPMRGYPDDSEPRPHWSWLRPGLEA